MVEQSGKLVLHQKNAPNVVMPTYKFDPKHDAQNWGWTQELGQFPSDAVGDIVELERDDVQPFDVLQSPRATALTKLACSAGALDPTPEYLFCKIVRLTLYQNSDFDLNGLSRLKDKAETWVSTTARMETAIRTEMELGKHMMRPDLERVSQALEDLDFYLRSLLGSIAGANTIGGAILEENGHQSSGRGRKKDVRELVCINFARAVYEDVTSFPPTKGKTPSFRAFANAFTGFSDEKIKELALSLGQ